LATTKRAITSRWRSLAPEAMPAPGGKTTYLIREFEIGPSSWAIHFTLFEDADATRKILSGRNSGTYRVLDAQPIVGAFAAEFAFDARELTPHTDVVAAALTASNCGRVPWAPETPQSVYPTGCPSFRVFGRDACPREFDLVRLEADRLSFGARPADGNLCAPERRPTGAGSPLVRMP
jgi:hypothetical protein